MRIIPSLFIVLSVALAIPLQAAASSRDDAKINWSTYADAKKSSSNSRKLLIFFYTEHCGFCKKLESKTFTNKDVVDYINANYTPVRVDAEKETSLASRYRIQGVPNLRFLSPEGKEIAHWPGYIESERLLIMLRYISTDSYKTKNYSEFVKEQK